MNNNENEEFKSILTKDEIDAILLELDIILDNKEDMKDETD